MDFLPRKLATPLSGMSAPGGPARSSKCTYLRTETSAACLLQDRKRQASAPILAAIPGQEAGDALVSAEFARKKSVLGMFYSDHRRLSLVQLTNAGDGVSLTSWGEPVNLDIGPFLVRFTADGRFALVNAMLLGTDIRGSISSIRPEQNRTADGIPHTRSFQGWMLVSSRYQSGTLHVRLGPFQTELLFFCIAAETRSTERKSRTRGEFPFDGDCRNLRYSTTPAIFSP